MYIVFILQCKIVQNLVQHCLNRAETSLFQSCSTVLSIVSALKWVFLLFTLHESGTIIYILVVEYITKHYPLNTIWLLI